MLVAIIHGIVGPLREGSHRPVERSSKDPQTVAYYTASDREVVGQLYARDISMFGYELPADTSPADPRRSAEG